MLRQWTLLAVERVGADAEGIESLTEFLPLASGVLFRETLIHSTGAVSVALTYAAELSLEDLYLEADPAAAGRRLTRP